MRLLNVHTRRLEEFFPNHTPPYAILSHTWGPEEVTLPDMQREPLGKKKGYAKINYTCLQAKKDGLSYAWIYPCCIDKTGSLEVIEAINSLFDWYRCAAKCYAYLPDFVKTYTQPRTLEEEKWWKGELLKGSFAKSRWFTESWTLPALIAPRDLTFYGPCWEPITTKRAITDVLSLITGVDASVLEAEDITSRLRQECVAKKMSWAAGRRAFKVEDESYSLFGLFDVHDRPNYGDGWGAFYRLQKMIMAQYHDQTLLAWEDFDNLARGSDTSTAVFARSPADFRHGGKILPFDFGGRRHPFTVNNGWLHIQLPVLPAGKRRLMAFLSCRYSLSPDPLAISLLELDDGTFIISGPSKMDRRLQSSYGSHKKAKIRPLRIHIDEFGHWPVAFPDIPTPYPEAR